MQIPLQSKEPWPIDRLCLIGLGAAAWLRYRTIRFMQLSVGEDTMDIKEQERTYAGFMSGTKYSLIAIIGLLVLMAVFLT